MKNKAIMIIKHEAVQRKIIGEIISRIEKKGLKIIAMKMMEMTEEDVRCLYNKCTELPYFDEMVDYNTNGPVIVLLVEGVDGNKNANEVCGRVGEMGTVRGDFVLHSARNVLHCSDEDVTEQEIPIFFEEKDIYEYEELLSKFLR